MEFILLFKSCLAGIRARLLRVFDENSYLSIMSYVRARKYDVHVVSNHGNLDSSRYVMNLSLYHV